MTRSRWFAATASPEIVAGVLVVVLGLTLLMIGTGTRPPDTGGAGAGIPSTPAVTASSLPSSGLSAATLSDVSLAVGINERLAMSADSLIGELDRSSISSGGLATLLREINASITSGLGVALRLSSAGEAAPVGEALLADYRGLREAISPALQAALSNKATYETSAHAVVARLLSLPLVTARLATLLTAPTPPAAAGPSASPSPSSTALAYGPNTLVNGGFEGGIGRPWELVLSGSSASARIVEDRLVRQAGLVSARVEILDVSEARGDVVVRQAGIRLTQGSGYRGGIALRAARPREVLLRVVAGSGRVYATTTVTVGPEWTVASVPFRTLVADDDARFEIDLGRSTEPLWLDEAFVEPSP